MLWAFLMFNLKFYYYESKKLNERIADNLSLNATLGEISVSGFITSDEGEPLSETTITCSGSQAKISSISGSGFYSVSSLRNNDVLTFSHSGYVSQSHQISSSQGSSQILDIEMSSASSK